MVEWQCELRAYQVDEVEIYCVRGERGVECIQRIFCCGSLRSDMMYPGWNVGQQFDLEKPLPLEKFAVVVVVIGGQ